ncbi:alpha/beta fold hydrolase [Haloferula sp. A504]|uniref:alpha/beta fold hydrolase n=1 Tax=Haloferula sp. A504 TaxID=3373601 RepID=UPI0031BE2B21|nr:alpha/beta hydrolase [Verrucomicrobiaceae bacterium E54]
MEEDLCATLPDGRRLSYARYGDPAGMPVIFHHGWPSSRYQAAFLDPIARERGVAIIAPDRPGVGHSDSRPGRHFSDWPDDLAGLADQLGIGGFRILGVSGGGPYALAACAGLGDRIERAAILCGAPPLADKSDRSHMHWVYRTLATSTRLRRMALPGVVRLSRWMVARGPERAPMSWMLRSIPEVDREAIFSSGGWAVVSRSFREATRRGAPGMLEDGEVYLSKWDFDPGKITVPVHFWHGKADANLPFEVARKLAATVPTAETSWIEGQGHYSLPVNHAGEALDWLKEG